MRSPAWSAALLCGAGVAGRRLPGRPGPAFRAAIAHRRVTACLGRHRGRSGVLGGAGAGRGPVPAIGPRHRSHRRAAHRLPGLRAGAYRHSVHAYRAGRRRPPGRPAARPARRRPGAGHPGRLSARARHFRHRLRRHDPGAARGGPRHGGLHAGLRPAAVAHPDAPAGAAGRNQHGGRLRIVSPEGGPLHDLPGRHQRLGAAGGQRAPAYRRAGAAHRRAADRRPGPRRPGAAPGRAARARRAVGGRFRLRQAQA